MLSWRDFAEQLCRPIRELVDVDVLRQSRVADFGGGAVGSSAVDILGRCGVGGFTVWDLEPVEVPNLARSVYTGRDLGRAKSKGLADHLKSLNPNAEVLAIEGDILAASRDMIVGVASRCRAAIVAADDFRVHDCLNGALWPVVPTVFTYVAERGDLGEILRTEPGEPGCVRCLTNHDERMNAGVARNFQALGLDMARIALDAAATVLGILLQGHRGGEMFADYIAPESRLLLSFSRRRGPLAFALPEGFVSGTVRVRTEGVGQGCPVCGQARR